MIKLQKHAATDGRSKHANYLAITVSILIATRRARIAALEIYTSPDALKHRGIFASRIASSDDAVGVL
jgi:hypothetical protein